MKIFAFLNPEVVLAVLAILCVALIALSSSFRTARRIIGLLTGLATAVIILVLNPYTFGGATGIVMIAIAVLFYCLIATGFVPWLYRTLIPSKIRSGIARVLVIVGYILTIVAVILGIGLLIAGLATI